MNGPLKILILLSFLAVTMTLTVDKKTDPEAEEAESVLGVHVKPLHEPLWYNILVPMLFEVPLPSWNVSDFSTKWPSGFGSPCEESDKFSENWTSMSCPIDYHLNRVIKKAYDNMYPWTKLMPNENEQPIVENFHCDEINPHFDSFVMTEVQKVAYIKQIKNCPPREYIYINHTTTVSSVEPNIYDTMLSRFIEEFTAQSKYRISGYVKYSTTINVHTVIQLAELLDFYENSKIFSDALAICANKRLPASLISKSDLMYALDEIKKIFSRKNFEFTLPLADLDGYYKQEISDCILTTSKTVLIRILVPLRKMDYPLQLFKLSPMTFLKTVNNNSEMCHYSTLVEHFIKDDNFNHFFVSECRGQQFCRIPDITTRQVANTCAHYLLAQDKEMVLKHCTLVCEHAPPEILPIFRRIDKDRFVIAGHSDMDIFVSCGDKPFKVISPPKTFGALEVILPCNCQIVYKAETLYSYGECTSNILSLKPVIPHQWTDLSSVYYYDDYSFLENSSVSIRLENEHEQEHQQGRLTGEGRNPLDDIQFYMNLQFTILSVVVILLIFSQIALFYLVCGIIQRLQRLPESTTAANMCRMGNL